MANKVYPFDVPGNYTYDTNKIEVASGLAKLKEDLTSVYARWHLNEATGATVLDSSGNERNGTPINNPISVIGKLNNALSFNGVNQYVNCGNIANFERTDAFSVRFWIKTTSIGNIIGKYQSIPPFTWRGWRIAVNSVGKIVFQLQHDYEPNISITVTADNKVVNDDILHEVGITYDGSSQASGVHIYINNNDETLTINSNNLTDTILNNVNCEINGYNNGSGAFINCLSDEIVIYSKELNSTEISYGYNSGNGRENVPYYFDKPIIEPTDLFDPATVTSWEAFLETLGAENEGSVGYNLYKVDKANKYYWNGSVWATGGDSDHYNSQVIVNANIGSFDAFPDKIGFIAYLISNGEQRVELDETQITYSENQLPVVNAGSNKTCKDNQSIAPFSDCSFSDPDGTIDRVYYKVDGEVDTWIEIPQGGYGTLLEAVQAWTYQFTNIGILTVRLQVEDNEGAKSEDYLTVTVSKYIVTFNVKDSAGAHLSDFYFLCHLDSMLPQLKSSPFTYEYEYKATPYETVFYKDNYVTNFVEVVSTDHTENVVLLEAGPRVVYPISIDLKREEIFDGSLIGIVKGDTVTFECSLKEPLDITDWKIRCEIWDEDDESIKKATLNSGGNGNQINITDAINGIFNIYVNKGETTAIADQGFLEIEMELPDGKLYTGYIGRLKFLPEKITWVTPPE